MQQLSFVILKIDTEYSYQVSGDQQWVSDSIIIIILAALMPY